MKSRQHKKSNFSYSSTYFDLLVKPKLMKKGISESTPVSPCRKNGSKNELRESKRRFQSSEKQTPKLLGARNCKSRSALPFHSISRFSALPQLNPQRIQKYNHLSISFIFPFSFFHSKR